MSLRLFIFINFSLFLLFLGLTLFRFEDSPEIQLQWELLLLCVAIGLIIFFVIRPTDRLHAIGSMEILLTISVYKPFASFTPFAGILLLMSIFYIKRKKARGRKQEYNYSSQSSYSSHKRNKERTHEETHIEERMSEKKAYEILNVSVDTKPEEVEKVWRELVKIYHPDHSKLPNAEKNFIRINEAYEFLKEHVF